MRLGCVIISIALVLVRFGPLAQDTGITFSGIAAVSPTRNLDTSLLGVWVKIHIIVERKIHGRPSAPFASWFNDLYYSLWAAGRSPMAGIDRISRDRLPVFISNTTAASLETHV